MQIQVAAGVSSRTITKKDGEEMTMHSQRAKLVFGGDGMLDRPFSLSLDDPSQAYAPGFYELGPESFVTNEYDRLSIGYTVSLTPVSSGKS